MSSTYRLLCLSHDPALVIAEPELGLWTDGEPQLTRPDAHPDCDLMVGRFSYPLIAVGCVHELAKLLDGETGHELPHPLHREVRWLGSEWALVGAAAQRTSLAATIDRCWTPTRLRRLAPLWPTP